LTNQREFESIARMVPNIEVWFSGFTAVIRRRCRRALRGSGGGHPVPSLVNPRAGFAGLLTVIRREKTQNTSTRNPVTCRTVCAILESDFSGKWPQPVRAIGRVAE